MQMAKDATFFFFFLIRTTEHRTYLWAPSIFFLRYVPGLRFCVVRRLIKRTDHRRTCIINVHHRLEKMFTLIQSVKVRTLGPAAASRKSTTRGDGEEKKKRKEERKKEREKVEACEKNAAMGTTTQGSCQVLQSRGKK